MRIGKNITEKDLVGCEFFRFSDPSKPINMVTYFDCLKLMKSLFLTDINSNSPITGFYINYITNVNDDSKNSVRLTYFTNSKDGAKEIIEKFLSENKDVILFPSKDSYDPKSLPVIGSDYGPPEDELRFRRFLNTSTQIGLDLIYFDVLYARRLMAEYRLKYFTQKKMSKPLFEPALNQHSNFFKELDDISKEQVWKDLDTWYAVSLQDKRFEYKCGDWSHFLVNMLLPGEFSEASFGIVFRDCLSKGTPIGNPFRELLLKAWQIDLPEDWNP